MKSKCEFDKRREMKFIIKSVLIMSLLLQLGCGDDKESVGNPWGIEQPKIQTETELTLLTDFSQRELSTQDTLVFNKKYENENIILDIVSTCDDYIQVYSKKIKHKILILELLPDQIFLSQIKTKKKFNDNMNCVFSFVAKNSEGSTHKFKFGPFKLNFFSLNEITKDLILLDDKSNIIKPVIKRNIFRSQKKLKTPRVKKIEIIPVSSQGDYHLVCDKFLMNINDLEKVNEQASQYLSKNGDSECIVLYKSEGRVSNVSYKFIFSNKIDPIDIKFIPQLKNGSNYKYDKYINFGRVKIKNNSENRMIIEFSKDKLVSQVVTQKISTHSIINNSNKKPSKLSRIFNLYNNISVKINFIGMSVQPKNNLYTFVVDPFSEVNFFLKYLLTEKQITENHPCYIYAFRSQRVGYEVNFPMNLKVSYNKEKQSGLGSEWEKNKVYNLQFDQSKIQYNFLSDSNVCQQFKIGRF